MSGARESAEILSKPVPPSSAPQRAILILADISGYTQYMTANAKSLAHSHTIITELVEAIVHHVEAPLKVAKLEGDAVFLYALESEAGQSSPWAHLGPRLLTFFTAFRETLSRLMASTTCGCGACQGIHGLRLKVIVHEGEILMHHVFHFLEIAGVDVILVHRLLKNSLESKEYLLLTSAAAQHIPMPAGQSFQKHREDYSNIGTVECLVYQPAEPTPTCRPPVPTTQRAYQAWVWALKLWTHPLRGRGDVHQSYFRNVSSTTTATARRFWSFFSIALLPVTAPASAVAAFLHSLKPSGQPPADSSSRGGPE